MSHSRLKVIVGRTVEDLTSSVDTFKVLAERNNWNILDPEPTVGYAEQRSLWYVEFWYTKEELI